MQSSFETVSRLIDPKSKANETKFFFVTDGQSKGSAKRSPKGRSAALSHVAAVTHQRRRALKVKAWNPDEDSEKAPSQQERERRRRESSSSSEREPSGLLTILRKGNSDAFQAKAIDVTPETHEIISFFKDAFLPASYGTASTTWFQKFAAKEEWSSSVACLDDKSCGLAFTLTYATIMAKISQSHNNSARLLTLKSKSFTALQANISGKQADDTVVMTCVLFLFAAEAFAGNLAEATVHGKTLRKLIEQKVRKDGPAAIAPSFFTRAIWYDVHLAQAKMVRTIFDVDERAATILEPTFRPTNLFFVNLSKDFAIGLDNALSHEPLRTIAIDYRQSLWLLSQGKPVGDDGGYSAAFWVHGRSYINQGRLVNHHLNNQELLQTSQVTGAVAELFWQTQSCLSLSLLLFVAHFGGDERVSAQTLLDVVLTVLEQLRGTLSSALRACKIVEDRDAKADSLLRPFDALLWSAFAGAQHEQKNLQKDPLAPAGMFKGIFAALARRMDLKSWPEVRERLERFVYSDFVQPNGCTWVEGLIFS